MIVRLNIAWDFLGLLKQYIFIFFLFFGSTIFMNFNFVLQSRLNLYVTRFYYINLLK
jgi:hypothetical protein